MNIIVDKRFNQLEIWLKNNISETIVSIDVASADASFRRYFRVTTKTKTLIAMDAPPEKENCQLFLNSAKALSKLGVNSPTVFAYDLNQGFMLLEDFGDRTFLDELNNNSTALYSAAMDQLLLLQEGGLNASASDWNPPLYDASKLKEEMSLFEDWFLYKHLGKTLDSGNQKVWIETQELLTQACLNQPQTWVHRDFHSRNLMITSDSPLTVGVIDFQDCVIGPIAYDLASIFKDCYIEWPRQKQQQWLKEYHHKVVTTSSLNSFSIDQLIEWVDFVGLQRHLKVLGIFCRLSYRDGKDHYLNDLPLVAKYVLEVLNIYPELHTFKKHFEHHISKAL